MSQYDYSKYDCYDLYKNYLQKVKLFAECYDYDTLGHLTYPFRYMYLKNNIRIDINRYKKDFEGIFNIVIKRNRGIEVNTSGIKSIGDTLPSIEIVSLYKELGGKIITIGSDAHVSEQVGFMVKETAIELKKIGFKCITTYKNRKPIFKEL